MEAWLWDHLQEAALVCQLIAFGLLARGWWLLREGRKLRKDFDYWRKQNDRRDR